MIKTNFLSDGIPKEGVHYPGLACITIHFVMRIYSASLFRRMQIQNKEGKDVWIHKHWNRNRIRIWPWIKVKVRIRQWIIVIFQLIAMLCFKQCTDGCFLDICFLNGYFLVAVYYSADFEQIKN